MVIFLLSKKLKARLIQSSKENLLFKTSKINWTKSPLRTKPTMKLLLERISSSRLTRPKKIGILRFITFALQETSIISHSTFYLMSILPLHTILIRLVLKETNYGNFMDTMPTSLICILPKYDLKTLTTRVTFQNASTRQPILRHLIAT